MLWRGASLVEEIKQSNQEIKNVLIQYRKVVSMIKHLDRKIEDLDDRMMSIKSGKITGMPRGGTPITNVDLIADKDDLEKRKDRFEVIAKQKKEIVQSYIDTVLYPRHNDFLTMYYVDCMSVEEISEEMPCSIRHAWRLYREAIPMVDLSLDL